MGFWDFMAVAACTHGRWLDDEPDRWGDRTCALCEQRVCVSLTEDLLMDTVNAMARQSGLPEAFPGVGRDRGEA
jgi:hypothetical protein